jgi:hypothetical protein
MIISAQAQLIIPAYNDHGENGECSKYVQNSNPAFTKWVRTFFNEYYSGSSVMDISRWRKMMDYVVANSEVGTYEIFTRTNHDKRKFYITYIEDNDGNLYDIIMLVGEDNRPDNVSFFPQHYYCQQLTSEFHQITNNFTFGLNYKLDRKLVKVLESDRHIDFLMDDGTRINIEFCHKKGDSYYEWGRLDTGLGVNGWKYYRQEQYGTVGYECDHNNHDCHVIPLDDDSPHLTHNVTDVRKAELSEICNH